MSVILAEGFDGFTNHTNTGTLELEAQSGWVRHGAANSQLRYLGTSGRFGGGCWESNNVAAERITFGARTSDDVIITSFNFKLTTLSGTGSIMLFQSDNGDTKGTFRINAGTGFLEFLDATGSVSTSTFAPTLNVWNFLEMKMKVGEANGTFELRVNQGPSQSATVLDVSGLNTLDGDGQAYINRYDFPQSTNVSYRVDDLIFMAIDGSAPNDFIGDGRIYTLKPDGDAGPNQWSIVGGSSFHFEAVNDIQPPDNNKYLTTGFLGNTELFDIENLPDPTESIDFVTTRTYVQRLQAGSSEIESFIRQSALDTVLLTVAPPGSRQHLLGAYKANSPASGQEWTFADINNLQMGLEVTV